MACRNPALARRRAHKRSALIEATTAELDKVRAMVARGTLRGAAAIGVRVGKVLNKYKVAKHFELAIGEASFGFTLRHDKVAAEAALDGLYVIRTGVEKRRMTADDAVRNYKALTGVERAFRSLKTVDLEVRPIHHRARRPRPRPHLPVHARLLRRVAHARGVARADVRRRGAGGASQHRDPVAPAQRSAKAELGRPRRTRLPTASPPHSFRTLLDELATHRPQHLRAPNGAPRYAYLLHRDASKPRPAARIGTSPDDPRVANRVTPDMPVYRGEMRAQQQRTSV